MQGKDLRAIITERSVGEPPIEYTFPQVGGLKDQEVQESINERIAALARKLAVQQGFGQEDLAEMIGDYRVTLNEQGLLSIRYENFSSIQFAAHPSTLVGAQTFNLKTGQLYQVSDFFIIGSDYRVVVNREIRRQIRERGISLLNGLKGISDNQPFYLTPYSIVFFFQEAEIAARVFGVLEFPIPYTRLIRVIRPNSPLLRLIDNNGKC